MAAANKPVASSCMALLLPVCTFDPLDFCSGAAEACDQQVTAKLSDSDEDIQTNSDRLGQVAFQQTCCLDLFGTFFCHSHSRLSKRLPLQSKLLSKCRMSLEVSGFTGRCTCLPMSSCTNHTNLLQICKLYWVVVNTRKEIRFFCKVSSLSEYRRSSSLSFAPAVVDLCSEPTSTPDSEHLISHLQLRKMGPMPQTQHALRKVKMA